LRPLTILCHVVGVKAHPLWFHGTTWLLAGALVIAAWGGGVAIGGDDDEKDISFEDQWKVFAERQRARFGPQFSRAVATKKKAIAIALRLDEEPTERLDALAEKAVEESVASYLAACREKVESMKEKERNEALERSYLQNAPNYRDAKFDPLKSSTWKDGLETLLGTERLAQWEARDKRLEDEKLTLRADFLLALFDREIGIPQGSREPLRQAIRDSLRGSSVNQRPRASSISSSTFGAIAREEKRRKKIVAATEPAVAEHIDAWLQNLAQPSIKLNAALPDRGEEEESVYRERVIAAIVSAQLEHHRHRHREKWTNRLAAVDRAAELAPAQRAELELAIRGMAELAGDELAGRFEQYARNYANRVSDGNYQPILKSLRVYRVAGREDESLWKVTLDRVLDAEQRERVEQWRQLREQLAPLIGDVIDQRMPEFEQQVPHRDPWYFDVRKMAFAYHAIGEERLREILTERQWQIWNARLRSGAETYVRILNQQAAAANGKVVP